MLTIDGDDASAVRSALPLAINTGGTYHLGGEGQPAAVTSDLTTKQNITRSHKFTLRTYIQPLQVKLPHARCRVPLASGSDDVISILNKVVVETHIVSLETHKGESSLYLDVVGWYGITLAKESRPHDARLWEF